MIMRVLMVVFLSVVVTTTLIGCGEPQETLTVIAGSELKDIEPKLDAIAKTTGVRLQMTYIGTLDGADQIVNGHDQYDLAWFSHAKYLSLLQGQTKRIKSEEKIGLSPVIPGVKESLARRWGWVDNPNVTWADIAAKARQGAFRYAMTDPTASNSGFSTVMGVQAAFAGSSDAITAEDVDVDKLQAFFSGQVLTSGSSGWLADAYVRDQDRIDGLFNYESILMNLNASGRLREKLILIYPKEGVVTADYPLILLNDIKRASYVKLVDYLKTSEFQQWMMENTNRRPVVSRVKASSKFPKGFQLELPFPSQLEAVNEILFAFLDQHRKPSHSIFVLDVSGSMEGDRLNSLKRALLNLTGEDTSLTGRFARFRNREIVTVISFNDAVDVHDNFDIGPQGKGIKDLRDSVHGLHAGGGTAIYNALEVAYDIAGDARAEDPGRFYSIVLMSDGDNTSGSNYADFNEFYARQQQELAGIRAFPVLFGGSNDREMNALAELTGGRVFVSRKYSLAHVVMKIRGYQ